MRTPPRHLRLLYLAALGLLALSLAAPCARASEERLRDEFMKSYWDIDSTRRLTALDMLRTSGVVEDRTKWMLYTVSHWDKDENVRRKAFDILTRAKDKDGYIAFLASLSFGSEKDIDLKVRKAEMMRGLDYKWHPLYELSSYLSGERYPRDGWASGWGYHYGWGGWSGWRGYGFASFGRHGLGFGRGLGLGGGYGMGFGGAGFSVDHLTVKQERERLQRYLDVINSLGDADFKVRKNFNTEIKEWWKYKNEEYKVRDERLRAERRIDPARPRMEPVAQPEQPEEKSKMSAILEYHKTPGEKKGPLEQFMDEEEDIAE